MNKPTSSIFSSSLPCALEGFKRGSAKIGIFIAIIIAGFLGFVVAERLGVTGTQIFHKGDVEDEELIETDEEEEEYENEEEENQEEEDDDEKPGIDKKKKSDKKKADKSKKKRISKSKKPSKAKASEPTPAIPTALFYDISRQPHTWPAFVRLTRSRSISVVDQQTGISMGRMDVPARTIVKIVKVNPNGTLDVFDRSGQRFQVEASGTNFAAAYKSLKTKPKKKHTPKKKVVAKKKPKVKPDTEDKPEDPTPVVASEPKRKPSGNRVSVFGTVITDEEWDEAEWED